MNAEGEEVEELFSGMYLSNISLSPDGTKLVFRMDLEGNIYLLDLGTQALNQITKDPDLTFIGPSWNTDGTKIVVTIQNTSGENTVSIWEMNVDGSDLAQILGDDDYWLSNARLSPKDDERIVFVSNSRVEVPSQNEIHLGDRDLSSRTNISDLVDEPVRGNSAPQWSSDANHILFLSQFQIHNYQVFSYDIEREEITQLTSEEAMHLNAIFSPVMRP